MNRFDRQIRVKQIGQKGQKILASRSVMIVGCGALGTYTSEQLIRAGIQELILIDPDQIEETNLQRQTLFTEKDAQKRAYKVEAAKEKLLAIRSDAVIHVYPELLEHAMCRRLPTAQLILDCTDNFHARQMINNYAIAQHLPFVFASCAGVSGQVMAISSDLGPCLSCVFPNIERLAEKSCDLLGVSTPIVPMVSSLQVSLAMKILIAPETVDWERFYTIDQWNCTIDSFKISKNPRCPACHTTSAAKKQANSEEPTIVKLCGEQVYQLILNNYSITEIEKICQKQNLRYQKSELAIQCKIKDYSLTFFKNGKIHCFDFPSKEEAKQTVQKLINYVEVS